MAKRISVKGPIVSNDIGWFYHYFGWDCCCPKDVSDGLEDADGDDVILEINSPGGYCDMGSEIYTMLMEYEGKVTAHIMSAASAASVIACAADEVLMSDTAVYMIHNTRGCASGDYRDMINTAEALEKYNEAIVNAYVRKTGKSREELHAMMDHTTWMSAVETVANGFADGYLFGEPGKESETEMEEQEDSVLNVYPQSVQVAAVNALFPMIDHEKAMYFRSIMELADKGSDIFDSRTAGERLKELLERAENSAYMADSDRETVNDLEFDEGGEKNMSLKQFLEENPEAMAEMDALLASAREEGKEEENSRLKELDAISASISKERLSDAKYGENRLDAKTLAYEALMEDGKKAASYMTMAVKDSKESNVDEVGSSLSDPEEPVDESDAYAGYINRLRAGRQ